MSTSESKRPSRSLPAIIFVFLIVVIGLVGGGYLLAPRFERGAPRIKLPDAGVLGLAPMEIVVTDRGAGVKSVSATLTVGGTEHTLVSEQYAQPPAEKKIAVALPAKLADIKEGPAVLRVSARDASLWNFFD